MNVGIVDVTGAEIGEGSYSHSHVAGSGEGPEAAHGISMPPVKVKAPVNVDAPYSESPD